MLLPLDFSDAFAEATLLNVSYDPTRRFYSELNKAFVAKWQRETGEEVELRQ
jgi:sulfate transport system substrate-binding protein